MTVGYGDKAFRKARPVCPPELRRAEVIDRWFPALSLKDVEQVGPGMWTATATWPADRLIWKDEAHEAVSLRMSKLYWAALRAGRDNQAERIDANLAALHTVAMVPWPENWSHHVRIDFSGEILCDGMKRDTLDPLELTALAMGFADGDGEHDLERARDFIEDFMPKDIAAREDVPQTFGFVSAASFADRPVPPRKWLVPDLVPSGTVTMLNGHGGVGKSLLALQLAVSGSSGTDWIGRPADCGEVLYISAEDEMDELHRRLDDIVRGSRLKYSDVAGLHLRSMVGQGALLAEKGRIGLKASDLANQIERFAAGRNAKLVVLDTLANLFPGDENDRAQVTQFVDILKGIALRCDCACLLLAHPSKSAMDTGDGYSGSTAWHGAVRSRLYLTRVITDGYEADPDARVLTGLKSNYGPLASGIALTWCDGMLVPRAVETGLDRMAAGAKAERIFLKLLDDFTAQGRHVSASPSSAFAPSQFASHPDAEGMTKRAFKAAMEALFSRGVIEVAEHGKGAKARKHIARKSGGDVGE